MDRVVSVRTSQANLAKLEEELPFREFLLTDDAQKKVKKNMGILCYDRHYNEFE